MSKGCWITILEKDEDKGRILFESVRRFGLAADGHFWSDDLETFAWTSAIPNLTHPNCGVWVIAGTLESFRTPSIRYGLSLLAIAVQSQRGQGFQILLIPDADGLTADALPTPLRDAMILPAATAPGAKIIARANLPIKPVTLPYRLNIFALSGLGQWFEIGPASGCQWTGAMFGIDSGEILAHGVGEDGRLPEKTILNYPMQGLKLQLGEQELTAWAVANPLTENQSYFVKITGYPTTLLFGELSETDDASMFRVQLQ